LDADLRAESTRAKSSSRSAMLERQQMSSQWSEMQRAIAKDYPLEATPKTPTFEIDYLKLLHIANNFDGSRS
jgi:hypothetical protein